MPLIKEIKPGVIQIDLSAFITAYYNRDKNRERYLKELNNNKTFVDSAEPEMYLRDAIDASPDFTPQQKEIIKKSPAYHYIKLNIRELFTNTIDEKLNEVKSKIEKFPPELYNPKIEIHINIEFTPSNDISIQISDNGRGFPDEFLNKLQTDDEKQRYIETKPWAKEKEEAERFNNKAKQDDPYYIGGNKRGIRTLMNYVMNSTKLTTSGQFEEYAEKPIRSEILFYNTEDGACLEVISSSEPLKLIKNDAKETLEGQEEVIMDFAPSKRFGKNRFFKTLEDSIDKENINPNIRKSSLKRSFEESDSNESSSESDSSESSYKKPNSNRF